MTDTVWLSTAPREPALVVDYRMEDRVGAAADRTRNMMLNNGGQHLDPDVLPQRAVALRLKAARIPPLFQLNGFLCVTERAEAVLGQHDLGAGGLHPLEMVQHDGATPVPGRFWTLNFGAKKRALSLADCRNIDGPYADGKCRPGLMINDDDMAVTPAALTGADVWGDELVETGFFVSPKLGQALHKANLANIFHLLRCRIV